MNTRILRPSFRPARRLRRSSRASGRADWGTEATGLWNTDAKARPVSANIIGNYDKVGPNTSKTGQGARGINLFRTAVPGSKFYIKGNIGPGRTSDSQDDWDTVEIGTSFDAAAFRSNTPIDGLASGFRPQSAQQAFEHVLKNAGALPRDAADKRAVLNIEEYINSLLPGS